MNASRGFFRQGIFFSKIHEVKKYSIFGQVCGIGGEHRIICIIRVLFPEKGKYEPGLYRDTDHEYLLLFYLFN